MMFALAGCSNFLSDPLIDPDRPSVFRSTASIDAVLSADVAEGAVTAMESITVNLSWDEPVTGFTSDDIVPVNAVVTSFSGSDGNYTFELEVDAEGEAGFSIPEFAAEGVPVVDRWRSLPGRHATSLTSPECCRVHRTGALSAA